MVLDALEYRFNPNFGTNTCLRLARFIDDPGFADDYWTEIFGRRGIRPTLTILRLPDPHWGWEPPYDDVLDSLLRKRGWHSRRSENRDEHYYDCWTYGPVDRIQELPHPRSWEVERQLTYVQCTGNGTYELVWQDSRREAFASREKLLRVLHLIEEHSWVPSDRQLR